MEGCALRTRTIEVNPEFMAFAKAALRPLFPEMSEEEMEDLIQEALEETDQIAEAK